MIKTMTSLVNLIFNMKSILLNTAVSLENDDKVVPLGQIGQANTPKSFGPAEKSSSSKKRKVLEERCSLLASMYTYINRPSNKKRFL
jgi:hypothetical protein